MIRTFLSARLPDWRTEINFRKHGGAALLSAAAFTVVASSAFAQSGYLSRDPNVTVNMSVLEELGLPSTVTRLGQPADIVIIPPVLFPPATSPQSRLTGPLALRQRVTPGPRASLAPAPVPPAPAPAAPVVVQAPQPMPEPPMPAPTQVQVRAAEPPQTATPVPPAPTPPPAPVVAAAPEPAPAPPPPPVVAAAPEPAAEPAPAPEPAPTEQVTEAPPPPPPAPEPAPAPVATASTPTLTPSPTGTVPPPPPEPEPAPQAAPAPPPEPEPEPVQTAARPASEDAGESFRVIFDDRSASISDAARGPLEELSNKMKASEDLRVQLLAYAEGTPETASQARRLSLSRALAVRSFLINQGVRSTRMDVRALGNKFQSGPADRVDAVLVQR